MLLVPFLSQCCKELLILHSRCLHLRQLVQEEDDPRTTLKVPYSSARVAVGSFHCRSSRLRVIGSLGPVAFAGLVFRMNGSLQQEECTNSSFFYDLGWAAGANPLEDPPLVIMVAFDRYQGPAFLTEEGEELRDQAGRLAVPILRVRHDFTLKNQTCSREQFPLVVFYL